MKYTAEYKIYNTKGRLAWQYNPFRNYRITRERWKVIWYTNYENIKYFYNEVDANKFRDAHGGQVIKLDKYQLVDFDTDELNFKITNPVSIIAQPSYDGSVNLIINDGINIPRLINSRFSVTGNDTYEIVDRKGNDDTNIYDLGELFNIDTSLYKLLDKIQKIEFKGTPSGGRMRVGNYHFYFKLMDADGNETDFIGQSLLVSVFIGNNPRSCHTGVKNQNSLKLVKFLISNIDVAYPYLSVYYSRSSAEGLEEMSTEYKKVLKKYIVTNAGTASVLVTGFELTDNISERDINTTYNIIKSAKTLAQNSNILFLGNVRKADIPYDILTAASLQFCPTVTEYELYPDISELYTFKSNDRGYYDPINIYSKVGYWPNEYYRFGIVYIMKSGELSPVFNVRGAIDIDFDPNRYGEIKFVENSNTNEDDWKIKTEILYNEKTYLIVDEDFKAGNDPYPNQNIKGVVKLSKKLDNLTNTSKNSGFGIFGIQMNLKNEELVIKVLRKYCKGFFFVRQKRIPTVLAQGLSIGIEDNSHVPMIPVGEDGLVKTITLNKNYNHIVFNYRKSGSLEVAINYLIEGFLTRYTFKFKNTGGFWSKIGSAMLIGVGVALIAVGSIVTCGAAGVIGGALVSAITASVTSVAITGVLVSTAFAVVNAAVFTAVAAINEVVLAISRATTQETFNGWATKAPPGKKIVENNSKSRKVGGNFAERLIIKSPSRVLDKALICPEYTVNQAYYNSIFTGNEHMLIPDPVLPNTSYLLNRRTRHFFNSIYNRLELNLVYEAINTKVIGVPEGVSIVGIGEEKFRSKAGEAEEAFRYAEVGNEYKLADPTDDDEELKEDIDAQIKNKKINSDIVRGIFGSYIGVTDSLGTNRLYNIMISGYSEGLTLDYLNIRAEDASPFFCISLRYDLNNPEFIDINCKISDIKLYSGDCYICQFTQRIIRNFNSPSLPYNDEILEDSTWRDHYDPNNKEEYSLINLGDVNAVQIGMWVTFKLRSSLNLNVRTLDESYVNEVFLSGHPRGFYPYHPMSTEGSYKLSEALLYNKGFSRSVSELYNYELPDSPYIKNWFGTRIMYSDIHINDAFRNGYRIFRPTAYRDYTREYGTITKLLSVGPYLIAVMEHGILKLAVDPSQVTTDSFINYKNILPENPEVISKDYGSEWQDSIILTTNYIYGVDTHAKKIWRTNGQNLELISENNVLRFLNEYIYLDAQEKDPILGRRNVKTIYNQFKGDVMFTFYNIKEYDEVAWNLCFNENLGKFVTFYSWIPSFMENINNIPISFDRERSRMSSILYLNENVIQAVEVVNGRYKVVPPIYNGILESNQTIFYLVCTYSKDFDVEIDIDYEDRLGKFFKVTERSTDSYIPPISANGVELDTGGEILNDASTQAGDGGSSAGSGGTNAGGQSYEEALSGGGGRKEGDALPITPEKKDDPSSEEQSVDLEEPVDLSVDLPVDESVEEQSKELVELEGQEFLKSQKLYELSTKDFESIFSNDDIYTIPFIIKITKRKEIDAVTGNEINGSDYTETKKFGFQFVTDLTYKKSTESFWIHGQAGLFDKQYEIIKRISDDYLKDMQYPAIEATRHYNTNYTALINIGSGKSLKEKGFILEDPGCSAMYILIVDGHVMNREDGDSVLEDYEMGTEMEEGRLKPDGYYASFDGQGDYFIHEESTNHITFNGVEINKVNLYCTHNLTPTSVKFHIKQGKYAGQDIDFSYEERDNGNFVKEQTRHLSGSMLVQKFNRPKPCLWYNRLHPFEFEFVVAENLLYLKIFDNIEIIANKALPESFHYEIVGDCYDFSNDKLNMYFRQEQLKYIYNYNGSSISYDSEYLSLRDSLKRNARSADFPKSYYMRQDKLNQIYDEYIENKKFDDGTYKTIDLTPENIVYDNYKNISKTKNFEHLGGAEIVWYKLENEFRVWNHAKAVNLDTLSLDDARSLIASNCKYLEDKWVITINPIVVCYKNEKDSDWKPEGYDSNLYPNGLPPVAIYNSPFPSDLSGNVVPDVVLSIDGKSWLDDNSIYGMSFGSAQNRKETDIRGRYIKIRIRYSGKELAIIDFINTIYRISHA